MNGLKSKSHATNWIGKSYGCELNFEILNSDKVKEIKCFTTGQTLCLVCHFWLYQ